MLHAGHYAYVGRRLRKRDMRKLWILRINAGVRQVDENLTYSTFINKLLKANISINRKMLAELAATDFNAFKSIVEKVRA